jgi:hypothetical protein
VHFTRVFFVRDVMKTILLHLQSQSLTTAAAFAARVPPTMRIPACLAALFAAFTLAGIAQQPAPPGQPVPPVAPAPEPPKVITKEKAIFVPFEKIEEVFAGEEQGVFLPYREFLEMWNKLNLPEKMKKVEPPVEGVVAGAIYNGKVEGDLAEIRAKVSFEALKEGWSQIPLGNGLALADAKTTALLHAADAGHSVIFPNKGSYTLEAAVFGKVTRDKGRATLPLKLPRTAVSQFELFVPDKGLEFAITPASAFSAVEQDGGTRLAVYFGASQEVTISWTKKGGETALPALLFADAATDLRLSAGAVHADVTLTYHILRAGVSAFDVSVPADMQVLSVEGANIREWKPAAGVAGQPLQKVRVELHTPAKDSYQLRLGLEAALPPLPQTVKLPVVEAGGVERQSGTVTVSADGELLVEAASLQGLTQQAVAQGKGAPPGVLSSYRYLRLPVAGALNVSQEKPQIEVVSQTLFTVDTELASLNATLTCTVKRAGIFEMAIELPDAFPNAEAKGDAVASSSVAKGADGRGVLTVKFKQRQNGAVAFTVSDERNRAAPDEVATVPVLNPLGVERHDAKVAVAVHQSLKANTTDRAGMREEDIGSFASLPIKDTARTPLTLGFRFRTQAAQQIAGAKLAFELRKPRVSAEVLTLLDVRETLTRHLWTVNYTVEFAGVNEFSIEVPKAIADDLQIEGANIKERIKTDGTNARGEPTGVSTWRVVLQDKVLGVQTLRFSHDAARGEQKPGAVLPVTLHEVKTLNVFRETGQVAVLKDGNLEFTQTDAKGLEAVDPKELSSGLQRDGIFLAYKYSQHPVSLALGVSKNFYLDVPQAVVTYAVLTSVIAEDEAETTEVIYWVRNNSQQFFSVQLPVRGGTQARLLSDAFVNGEPLQPGRRPDRNELLIRLPARQESNAEFPVRFVYEVPSATPGRKMGWRSSVAVEPPRLADVKVLQTRWTLYLPATQRYVDFGGAMTENFGAFGWERFARGLRLFVPKIGPEAPPAHGQAHAEPPPLPPPRSAGFDTQLRREGVRVELRRMDAPAAVNVAHRGKPYSFVIESLTALLTLAGAIRLLRAGRGVKWMYFIFIGLGALVVSGAVNPRAAGPWQMAALGVFAGAALWIAAAATGGIRGALARSAERKAQVSAAESAARAAEAAARAAVAAAAAKSVPAAKPVAAAQGPEPKPAAE